MHFNRMDANNALLNSSLDFEIFMQQLQGFLDKDNHDCVRKLDKIVLGKSNLQLKWYITIKQGFVGGNDFPSNSGLFSGVVDGALCYW